MVEVVVVTGAGGGLGTAIAQELATRYHIALIDIDQPRLAEIARLIGPDRSSAHQCDITDEDAINAVAAEIGKIGPVKILVNNAGHAFVDSLQETTPSGWRREIALNLDAAFICFKAFEAPLKTTPGASVVNVASVNAFTVVGSPAYSAAKAGMVQLTAAIAVEYAPFGLRCNAVAPGSVRTGAWDERLAKNPEAMDEVLRWYPLKRAILPRDVAKAVAFLSSEDAASITGVCLPVDAGLLAGSLEVARAVTNSPYF